jgi:DNA-binding NarL/FixJ family response regulator
VRSALVCVRTPLAAQSIASCASRLGVVTIRTATSAREALARLTERPAELILVDTAITRPDTVGFTRRALDLAPGAVLVLFGPEDPQVAAAARGAGARGLVRGGEQDLVAAVTKALLLIDAPPPARPPVAAKAANGVGHVSPTSPAPTPIAGPPAARPAPTGPARVPGQIGPTAQQGQDLGPAMVPAQRADAERVRRVVLTERELQVLRGMAEGKSNAEIGRELYVSEDTVKTHARRLFRKLRARDRAHAVAVGFRSGALS